MKILIISTYFPPQNSIASLRPYSWAKYWTKEGHTVTVLTTQKQENPQVMLHLPNPGYEAVEIPFPTLLLKVKNRHKNSQSSSFSGKILQSLRENTGIFKTCRMPDLTDLWVRPACAAACEKGPWDLVISTAGPYTTHLVAHRLKKRKLAKLWVADYRDAWSYNHIYPGLFPFNIIEKRMESHLLKHADLVTTVSNPLAKDLKNRFQLDKVEVVANGLDVEDLDHIPKDPIFINDGKFRIAYTGSIYKGKQDPSPLFQSIKSLSENPQTKNLLDNLEVIFAGPNQEHLEKQIRQMEISTWVKSIGFISREDSLRMQRDAHALLFLPWNDTKKDGILTGKIFEYLFSKTPIICIGKKQLEASQLLALEAKAGQCLYEVDEISTYLLEQLAEVKKEMPATNFAFLRQYTRESLAKQLIGLIESYVI